MSHTHGFSPHVGTGSEICAANVFADVVCSETNICYVLLYVNKGSYMRTKLNRF